RHLRSLEEISMTPPNAKTPLQTARTIAAFLMASVLIYVYFAYTVTNTPATPDPGATTRFGIGFFLASIFSAVCGTLLGHYLPSMMKNTPMENRLLIAFVVRYAFYESIAINGLLLTYMTHQFLIVPYVAVCLILMLVTFPNQSRWFEGGNSHDRRG